MARRNERSLADHTATDIRLKQNVLDAKALKQLRISEIELKGNGVIYNEGKELAHENM